MSTLIRTNVPGLTFRAIIPHDLDTVLQLVDECPEVKWPRDEFAECFHSPDVHGEVAEVDGQVIGFLIGRLDRSLREVYVKSLAVAPAWRRRGVGRALIELLDAKLHEGYDRLRALVPESSLSVHQLLRAGGFRAVRLFRAWFGDEHAYLFEKKGAAAE